MTTNVIDPKEKWLYRVGALSALLIGILYLIITAMYALAGSPPTGGEGWLSYLAGETTVWWAIVGLSILTDLLLIPVALSLYAALKGVNRDAILIATAFIGLFVVLDLAVTWPNYSALISLSSNYAQASNDVQRTAYIAAASYSASVLASTTEAVYSIALLSFGILLAGLVMLKGVFGKSTAYLGIMTGTFGIISVVGPFFISTLGAAVIVASVLTMLWAFFIGYKLYELGSTQRQVQTVTAN